MSHEVCRQRLRTVGLVAACVTFAGPAALATSAQDRRPVVAVFAFENQGAQLDPQSAERIRDYVGAQLVSSGGFLVVPPEELRQALARQKAESYRSCYDESCQIEVGKELAAEKTLAGVVARIGSRCVVTLKLYDLRRSAQEAAGTAKGSCDEDGVLDSIEKALRHLVGQHEVPPPRPIISKSYRALRKHAEATQQKAPRTRVGLDRPNAQLAHAWSSVSTVARTPAMNRGLRLAALERFLIDFPNNNPYAHAARAFSAALSLGQEPTEGSDMVAVPAGAFIMGCRRSRDPGCDRNSTTRRVSLPMFYIDRTEVTVAAYRRCVAAGRCSSQGLTGAFVDGTRRPVSASDCNWNHPDRDDHPINCVDWYQARAFCAWENKRLPSEQEWEKAARGADGRPYPWGRQRRAHAVIAWRHSSTAPVASIPAGASPFGAMDMVGNVWEWTITRTNGARWRGASFGSSLDDGIVYRSRAPGDKGIRARHVGFRCASTVHAGLAKMH